MCATKILGPEAAQDRHYSRSSGPGWSSPSRLAHQGVEPPLPDPVWPHVLAGPQLDFLQRCMLRQQGAERWLVVGVEEAAVPLALRIAILDGQEHGPARLQRHHDRRLEQLCNPLRLLDQAGTWIYGRNLREWGVSCLWPRNGFIVCHSVASWCPASRAAH